MRQRDAQGYIILSDSDSASLHAPQQSLEPYYIDPLPRLDSDLSLLPSLHVRLTAFYATVFDFVEEHVLKQGFFQFFSKYLLYPFISGSLAASTAYFRSRYLARR